MGGPKAPISYEVRDSTGKLVAIHVRLDKLDGGKNVRWKRPSGEWGLNGTPLVDLPLYGIHELDPEAALVVVTEGEKARDALENALREAGITREQVGVVGTVTGASVTPSKKALRDLQGLEVILWPDADNPGRKHMERVAERLDGVSLKTSVYDRPDAEEKDDAAEHPAVKGGDEKAMDLLLNDLCCAPKWGPLEPEIRNGKVGGKPGAAKQRNQADRLIDYARETGAELFLDQFDMPHALVDGEAVPLNSRSYNWLRTLMWAKENASVGGDPLKTAAGTLAAFAANEGRTRTLHTRAAYHEGAVYYQLGKGRVWRIDREGSCRDDAPPVVFRSISNLKPLPDPEAGGTLEEVCSLINIKSRLGRRLWLAHTVITLLGHIPRPIEEATGGAGAGKSTFSRYKKRLLDPTAPESIRLDKRDFLQKADHCFIILCDNLNSLPEWAEDTLCRLVTGEGDSKRVLYSDDNDYVFEMKRAILLNGINQPADRSDVRDRTLPVELRRIPDDQRRSEEELWEEFREKHPRMLGAILDTLSRAIRAREGLTLPRRPRLADWGEYAAAVYECEGWSEGDKRGAELFLEDWDKVVLMQDRGTVEGSLLAQAIVALMKTREEYRGFASDLYRDLRPIAEDDLHVDTERDKDWPTNAVWLARQLREIEPTLDSSFGIEVQRKNHKKGSYLIITKRGDGGDDPGSGGGGGGKDPFTSTLTPTLPPPHNPDTYGEGGGKASSGGKTGYFYLSHPRTAGKEGVTKRGEVNTPESTSTTSTTSFSDDVGFV